MKKFLVYIILNSTFLILHSFCFSQNHNIDSLLILLKTENADTNKLDLLNKLSWEYDNIGSYDSAMLFAKSALQLSNTLLRGATDQKIIQIAKTAEATSYNNIGNVYSDQSNFPEALKSYLASLKIREAIGSKKGIAGSYNNIGYVYYKQGNYPEALKNHLTSLKIKEQIGDKSGIASSYNNIGNIYLAQSNFSEALKSCLASLKIKKEMGDKTGIAISYNNIGAIYYTQKNFSEALKNYFPSLKIYEAIGDKAGIAGSYNNIGTVYEAQGDYQEAMKNYFASLKIKETIGDNAGIASSYINLGNVFTKQKKYKEAEEFLIKAKELSKEIGYKEYLRDTYNVLKSLDSAKGNFKGAYENHKLFILYRDSLDNEETRKKTIESTLNYEFEKKEFATKVAQEKKDANATDEGNKQKIIRNSFIAGFLLMLFFGIIIAKAYRQKYQINNHLKEKNRIIASQKLLVEEKNKDISDSVAYAKRIQSSFLTSETYIKRHIADYFILYKPKDVVSGDFYWMHKQNNYLYFCIADCTGHGIPGAFMSLIGMGILNEIIYAKQISDTNKILDELRRIVIMAVNPEGAIEEGKDGMDLVLCRLNLQTKELQYSAANNSFYVSRKGELLEYKPDKMPIGKFGEHEKPFSQHKIQLEENDIIYAITDGYADQFGGPKGKKFKYKQLEEQLIANRDQSMEDQKKNLEYSFNKWKGDLEQVDDVTIVGIRV